MKLRTLQSLRRRVGWFLVCTGLLLSAVPNNAFTVSESRTIVHRELGFSQRRSGVCFMGKSNSEGTIEVRDCEGKPINVGAVVRVCAEGLEAYHVPSKAQGCFNEEKEFVPVAEGSPRSDRNLKIPVGLRGKVAKVFTDSSVSANFRVQVKFEPGENIDEGFDPPVAFLMHLASSEVELV